MGIIFDVVVVGGGPAALGEVIRLQRTGQTVALISDRLGGCMAMLGNQPLQSYVCELEIEGACQPLGRFMQGQAISPTGTEFAAYVAANLQASSIATIAAKVLALDKHDELFTLFLDGQAGIRQVHARQVVLATGIRPRPWTSTGIWRPALNCFETYAALLAGDQSRFADREVIIFGSGNTAFQLAAAMVPLARDVTVLAHKYLGLFPQETDNRFALRALSQRALELVAKTAIEYAPGALNGANAGQRPRLWLHAYDRIDKHAGQLRVRLPDVLNQHPLLRNSCLAATAGGRLQRSASGHELVIDTAFDPCVLISATGVTANLPDLPWHDLVDADTGFVINQNGSTRIPGLYVAGAACGFASVNTMQPISAAHRPAPRRDRHPSHPQFDLARPA